MVNLDLENLINSVGVSRRRQKEVPSDASASQKLKKWWIAERTAPTLLPYQEGLLSQVVDEIRKLRDRIEETSLLLLEQDGASLDPLINPGDVKVQLLVSETELERVKYIARAYKRTRMEKIDRLPYFFLKTQSEDSGLMSKDEWIYCHRHAELLALHYHSSFLESLPEELQDLTETTGHISMIEEPDMDQPVAVKVVKDVPGGGVIQVGEEAMQLENGSLYFLRYSAIQSLLDYVELV